MLKIKVDAVSKSERLRLFRSILLQLSTDYKLDLEKNTFTD